MPDHSSRAPADRTPKRALLAFKQTVDIANLILAPLAIFASVFRVPDIFALMMARPWSTLSVTAFLIFSFLVTLWRPRITIPRLRVLRVGKILAVLASFAAIAICCFWIVAAATSGVHFVVMQSQPDRAAAQASVVRINDSISDRQLGWIRAHYYSSAADNPWFSIVLGGPHFSRTSAEETLDTARQKLPGYTADDAYIRSYELQKWLALLIRRLRP